MIQPDFTFNTSFSGNADQWADLSRILGVPSNQLARDGMMPHVGEFVARRRGDPLSYTDIADLGDHLISPIGYRLARSRGCDPVAIALLSTLSCTVGIEDPESGMTGEIDVHSTRDAKEVWIYIPFLTGFYWRGKSNGDSDAQIRMRRRETGLPDTVITALQGRMVGRPLRENISHPLLDGHDIVVNRMKPITDASENWLIGLDGVPPMVPIRSIAF